MAATNQQNNADSIISALKSINCCDFCILRYLNNHSFSDYSKSISKGIGSSSKNLDDEPVFKMSKNGPCSACLGLLQPNSYEEQVEKIVQEVESVTYDADEVTFALSLPVSLQVRNHSIWLFVTENHANYYVERRLFSHINDDAEEFAVETNVVSIKEAWKGVVAPLLAKRLGRSLNSGVDCKFFVNINFEYPAEDMEVACMGEMHPDIFGDRKNHKRKYHNEIFTRKSVETALEKTDSDLFKKFSSVPPSVPDDFIICSSVACYHDNLYIAGRYNKFSRSLSQTPWLINGQRRMDTSVEEIIRDPIAKVVPNDVVKFMSSGREDVDVRMLGLGRPFVLDFQNPRRTKLSTQELRQLETEINSSSDAIFIRDLQIVPKSELVHIKTGEQTKTKTYACYCVVKGVQDENLVKTMLNDLNKMESFVLQQKTPVRVLHRRPLAVRPRTIHWIQTEYAQTEGDSLFFHMNVKVEAGTYVKELVHGDLGRTTPNISQILGYDVDILALDVNIVDLPWPPRIDENLTN